ncbi:MAG: LysR substrate-binding domain-containing protein [Pseudomonadota bacterium]
MAISPPRPMGPPLNALRALEAAARLGSFKAAGDELSVSAGAIAQHIKTLEAWAGAPLFQRRAQGVELTDLGRTVLPGFTAAFDQLSDAVQTLRTGARPNDIRIAALPSIAQLWLSPRLPEIRERAEGVTISVTALETPPVLKREQFDLCVFIETEPDHPAVIEVCTDTIFPVCAPGLARRLKRPEDLVDEVCLRDAAWDGDWARWFEAAGTISGAKPQGPVFSLYSLAVEEAKNGAGVLMGHEPLVRPLLEAGTLVAPFDVRVPLVAKLVIGAARPVPPGSSLAQVVELLCK